MLKSGFFMSKVGKINRFFWKMPHPGVNITFCGYVENYPPDHWYHPNRICPFWRFYWGATEGADLIFRDQRLELNPQFVVFVPPDISIKTRAEKPFSQLFMHFDWPEGPALAEPALFSAEDELKILQSSRNWFETETESESMSLHMYSLLFGYLPLLRKLESRRPKKIDPRIERALRMLDDAKQDLPLREIAKEVSMSYYHFLDTFKKQVGVAPGHYLMTQRMNYAQYLLLHTDRSIEEIAQETGFTNRFHFSKAFKQFFKQPPGEYRKMTSHPESPEYQSRVREMEQG